MSPVNTNITFEAQAISAETSDSDVSVSSSCNNNKKANSAAAAAAAGAGAPNASSLASNNSRSGTGGKQRVSSSLKRVIDETQLSPEEADRLQVRRAYNRECATRARKRTKTLVTQLQDDIKQLQEDKDDLRRENAVMKAQLEGMEKQNQTLLFKQAMNEQRQMAQVATMNAFGAMNGGGIGGGGGMGGLMMQPGMKLGDALTELRMANLTSQESAAASRARLLFQNTHR